MHSRLSGWPTASYHPEIVAVIGACCIGLLLQNLIGHNKLIRAGHGMEVDIPAAIWLVGSQSDREDAVIPAEGLPSNAQIPGERIEVKVVVLEGPHPIVSQVIDVQSAVDQIRNVSVGIAALTRFHIDGDAGQSATRLRDALRNVKAFQHSIRGQVNYPNAGTPDLLAVI